MRKLWYTTATLAAITLGTVFIGTRAEAMPISPGGVQSAVDTLTVIEKAQFVIDGRRYCWYDDGWQGPGWYWCGYRWRRGLGWGGGVGWHNWQHKGSVKHMGNSPKHLNNPGNVKKFNNPGNVKNFNKSKQH